MSLLWEDEVQSSVLSADEFEEIEEKGIMSYETLAVCPSTGCPCLSDQF